MSIASVAASVATAEVCDLDSPASPATLVDGGFNQAILKDGNGGWFTPADPGTGLYPFLEAGTHAPGTSFRVTGQVGNYSGTSGTNFRDLDFIRFTATGPCYAAITLSMGRDLGGFVLPFGQGEVSELSVYTGNVQSQTEAVELSNTAKVGCPNGSTYVYPNGRTQVRVPVAAGADVLVIATTPKDASLYAGPILYGLDVTLQVLDNASCGTATGNCVTARATSGCSDAACCDLVCTLEPDCCSVAWDNNCIQTGVSECGNFVYACDAGGPANDCATSPEIIDVASMPVVRAFDTTNASTDGPNNLLELCGALTARDIWYQIGPMPADADVTISMCGVGNLGDSVISTYNLGAVTGLADGQTLPALYRGCRDDYCDDDGDGTTDAGGPSAYTMVNVLKDNTYLIRIGTYLEPGADPDSALALQGQVSFNVRTTLWNSGRQRQVIRNSDNTALNLTVQTGYRSTTDADYMLATPFTLPEDAQVEGLEFCASTTVPTSASAIADRVKWVIFARDGSSAAWMGTWNPGVNTVVAEGELVFDSTAYSNISSDAGRRYFLDFPTPFMLTAGSYFMGLKGTTAGSTSGALGFYVYGQDGIEHFNPANNRACWWNAKNYATAPGTWVLTTASSTATYRVQTGDRAGVLYHAPIKLKGTPVSSMPCFGDLDFSMEVDNGDVAFALLDFGSCQLCASDLDGTGEVDFGDVALILLSTGPCQ
ncbi:MAG: hypothetical protein FJ292_04945 [Planctomycetes bacterium]|nr:hypothetical protein [Planctomycetota bacterium]